MGLVLNRQQKGVSTMKLEQNSTGLEVAQRLNQIRNDSQRKFDFIMTCDYNEPFCLMAGKMAEEHGRDALIEFINSDRWEPSYPIK